MFGADERLIAGRYLRPRRSEGFVTVIATFSLLGIALGVGTLIVVMAVMNGFRAELVGRIVGLNGHIIAVGGPDGLADYGNVALRLGEHPSVVSTEGVVEGQVMATGPLGNARGVVVRGISLDNPETHTTIRDSVFVGVLNSIEQNGHIAIGTHLAAAMGVNIGESLTLISPEGQDTAFGTIPRTRSYTIGAIFDVGMFEYDSSFVFMSRSSAQVYFNLDQRVSYIEMMVEDPQQADVLRREMAATNQDAVSLRDWKQNNRQFFNALQVERNVMFLILTLIIIVAAFNIISGMIILVRSKSRDVAILRTMGATRGAIMRIFFMTGTAIGVLGTFLGFLLGVGFATNIESIRQFIQSLTGTELFSAEIYFLSKLPAKIEMDEVLLVVLMALCLAFLASLYPAWRAARLDPVKALRHD